MISFEMEDLIGVLQGLTPYLVAIGLFIVAAIVITSAVSINNAIFFIIYNVFATSISSKDSRISPSLRSS